MVYSESRKCSGVNDSLIIKFKAFADDGRGRTSVRTCLEFVCRSSTTRPKFFRVSLHPLSIWNLGQTRSPHR